jgi:hypothetical protein
MSPPGRPKGERRSAQHEGSLISPLRESWRVLQLRLRLMHWLFGAAGVTLCSLLFVATPLAQGAALASMLAVMALLWFHGAVLAVACLATAGPGRTLVPGAHRALWRASGWIGLLAIVMVSVALLVTAWAASLPIHVWPWLAGSSLALASGFALMVAANSRQHRAVFWAIALLPLTVWPVAHAGGLSSLANLWLLAVWASAWPACVWQLARLKISTTRDWPLHAVASLDVRTPPPSAHLRPRGFDSRRADIRWLVREPWQRRDVTIAVTLICMAVVAGWDADYSSQNLILQACTLLIATVLRPMALLRAFPHPRLLLLPGGVARPDLAWTMFRQCLRMWSGGALIVLLVGGIITVLAGGHDLALRGVSVGLILAGQIVLDFGSAIAMLARTTDRDRRVTFQLLTGIVLTGSLVQIIDILRLATVSMFVIALALGLLQATIGVLLVRASTRAWSRFDWVRSTPPARAPSGDGTQRAASANSIASSASPRR